MNNRFECYKCILRDIFSLGELPQISEDTIPEFMISMDRAMRKLQVSLTQGQKRSGAYVLIALSSGKTIKQVSKELGLKGITRIPQIRNKALRKLRHPWSSEPLRRYL